MKIFVFNKKLLFIAVIAAACLLLALLRVCAPASGRTKELPIYSVDREDMKISVTFDCAWNDNDIDDIIKVLGKYNCVSTFFVVGDWAKKYPDAVKRLSEAGHEISNHSYNHTAYTKLSKEKMKEDMDRCDKIIEEIISKKSVLFRAPSGDYNKDVVRACAETGRYCIQWDVDSLDWRDLTEDEITNRVLSKTKSGSIILLHNGTPNTYKALEKILPGLAEKGFEFAPVSELIYKENYIIDHEGKQKAASSV